MHGACATMCGRGLIAEDLPSAIPDVLQNLDRGSVLSPWFFGDVRYQAFPVAFGWHSIFWRASSVRTYLEQPGPLCEEGTEPTELGYALSANSASAHAGGGLLPSRQGCFRSACPIGAPSDRAEPCGRGGTGRHAGFRFLWASPWGFKSLRPHQKLPSRQRRDGMTSEDAD